MITLKHDAIQDLVVANTFIKAHYGNEAALEEFFYKKDNRFRFLNIHSIRNYPAHGFKSVQKAMNCLLVHESWTVRIFQNRRKNKKVI